MLLRQKSGFLPSINQRPAFSNRRLTGKAKQPNVSWPEEEKSRTITISEDDIARFRKPLHQCLCVSMLQEGFHRSFEKFFSLLQSSNASQLVAEQGSSLPQQHPLKEQPHKLTALKEHLTRAEAAERRDKFKEVYDNYWALAKFFSEPEDRWLQQHFYELSLLSTRKLKTDFGRKEAEARAHLGQLHIDQGTPELAVEHYEVYHQLVAGQSWQDENGHSYQSHANEGLCMVYTLLAEKQLQIKEYRQGIEMLTKAYNVTLQGNDKMKEGEAIYRIALAYQSASDHTTAKQFLNRFVEICIGLGESDSVRKAYKAFAKSLESEGKVNESLHNLQKYAETSQESNQDQNLQDACMCIGSIHSSRGEFNRACEYFTRATKIASVLGSVSLLEKAQACVGIAQAHNMLREYSALVMDSRPQNLCTLLHWSDRREKFHRPQDEKK